MPVAACLALGCPLQIVQDFADGVSDFVDDPLNEFLPTEVIGLQFRNDGDAPVSIDIELDQGAGLTNRGRIVAGEAAFTGIELLPGQTLGDVSGCLTASGVHLFAGTGLYPCVRGRVCVRARFGDETFVETCVELGSDFECGQGLVFIVDGDGKLKFAAEAIGAGDLGKRVAGERGVA